MVMKRVRMFFLLCVVPSKERRERVDVESRSKGVIVNSLQLRRGNVTAKERG